MSDPSGMKEPHVIANSRSNPPRKEDPTYATKTATFRLAMLVVSIPFDCSKSADNGTGVLLIVAEGKVTEGAIAFEPAESI